MQAESPITVACIQMEPKIGEKKANVAHSLDEIAEAAGKGARLIVLHELCNSGYVFASRHEAFTLAEPVPNGPTTEAWLEAARRHGAVIVAGICARAGDALYNSAAILGPDGFIGTYRKVYLWGAENPVLRTRRSRRPRMEDRVRPNGGGDLLPWLVSGNLSAGGAARRRHPLRANQLGSHARPAREHASHGEYPRDGRRTFQQHVCRRGRPRGRGARPALSGMQPDRQPYRVPARGSCEQN